MNRETMLEYGIEYDKGMKNCMGNLPFYKKILSMFLDDHCFDYAKKAYLAGDNKELFSRMHEMKGISGNAALTEIYTCTVPLVELLRTGSCSRKEIEKLFTGVEAAYIKACEGIKAFLAEI